MIQTSIFSWNLCQLFIKLNLQLIGAAPLFSVPGII